MARHLIMVCRPRRQVPSISYFQPIKISGVPNYIVLERAFPCTPPFRSLTITFTLLVWTNFQHFLGKYPLFLLSFLLFNGWAPCFSSRRFFYSPFAPILKIKFVTFGGHIFYNQIRLCAYLLSKHVRRRAKPLVTQCKVFSALLTEDIPWLDIKWTILV